MLYHTIRQQVLLILTTGKWVYDEQHICSWKHEQNHIQAESSISFCQIH